MTRPWPDSLEVGRSGGRYRRLANSRPASASPTRGEPGLRSRGRRSRVVTPSIGGALLEQALERVGQPFLLVRRSGGLELEEAGSIADELGASGTIVGFLPACRPEMLGDASFRDEHGLRYAYVSGAMANGIGSAEIAEAMGRSGMLGIFGAAGLPIRAVE